jgi:pimeloyl-ACP methyl ester carboxylesterase
MGSSGDWVHLFDLDALAKRWRLVMPDARGHGRSTNPSGVITHRQAADDIRALLDHRGTERCKESRPTTRPSRRPSWRRSGPGP